MMRNNNRFAGLGPRFLALFVDLLLFCAIFFPATRLIKGTWMMSAADHRWNQGLFISDPICIAFLVVMALYYILLEGFWGATFGKRMLRIRVERAEGGKPGLIKSLWRNVLRLVDGLPAFGLLGIVLILTSRERARFGDRVAGTRVVKAGR